VETDRSYLAALRELWRRSSYERGFISNPFVDQAAGERGLRRVELLLAELGYPQLGQQIVHVAGSKGKGSTASMIAAIAGAAGFPVGLYTSPHLHSFRERIAINGEPISEPAFAAATWRAAEAAEQVEVEQAELGLVTTFELLTAMALDTFHRAGCQVTVLEVGLGGTFDATNVVTPLVSVITTLDLEHTAVLGPTLADIAQAKAGIIKPGVPVVVAAQPDGVIPTLTRIAAKRQSPLSVGGAAWSWRGTWQNFSVSGPWGSYGGLRTALPGGYQTGNAATAIAATWLLNQSGVAISEEAVRAGLGQVKLPGRFEQVAIDRDVTMLLDGAHSPASARALAQAIQDEFGARKAVIVLGTSADKDIAAIGRALAPVTDLVIATRSSNPRAAPSSHVVAGLAEVDWSSEVIEEPDLTKAIERAIASTGKGGFIVITGSLFTVADAREALGLGTPDPPYQG
jgi:dihydrofolate synthase/folylpolyglutamate synthase